MGENVVQVRADGTVLISCPHCTCLKNVSVEGFQNVKRALRIKCVCGARFSILLEFRQWHRKPTDIGGYYVRKELYRDFAKPENRLQKKTNCRLKNISREGVGFVRLSQQQVLEGSSVWLQFTLDDLKKSTITSATRRNKIRKSYRGMKMDLAKIVRLVAVLFAVVAGLVAIPQSAVIIAVLGLVVGWFVEEDRRLIYMVFALTLALVHGSLSAIPAVGGYLTDMLASLSALANAGAVTVIVMTTIDRIKP